MKKLLLVTFLSLTFIRLTYAGPDWITSLSGAGQIWSIAINPSNQLIMYAASNTTGIWKTIDGGNIWAQTNSGLTNLTVQSMAISASSPNILYCGTSQTGGGAGIYKSTDAGATWTQVNTGIVESSIGVQSIAVDPTNPNNAYVAIFDGVVDATQGLYKTTNGGTAWTVANTGIGAIKNFLSIIINPLNPNVLYCGTSFAVVAGTGPQKIYKSVNAAVSWTDMSNGLPSLTTDVKPVRCLSMSRVDTSIVLAGLFMNTDSIGGGMYVTTNGGGLWTRRNSGVPNLVGTLPRSCLIRPGSNTEFYVGLGNTANSGIGVFRTTNAGLSWTDFNGGTLVNTTSIRALNFKTIGPGTVYAGGAHPTLSAGQGVFENALPVGIGNQYGNIPKEFLLKQNYPNPFNPKTIINYQLPIANYVTLTVYDINGREIKTLINERQSAGSYEVSFDGSNLSSGVYMYKLTAGEFTDIKKMMIVK